ncbi:hypothetical protein CBW65_03575 [Tumebacillus avium]|uniref:Carrier domain-containing protein n=1 Tax=Tumebacillus avium TaxID=1903704 RepID=A0A1Y0IIB3_9BACL|nr:non-ribosomal peptide synthetase [Tumebacillus avium]ARU60242.1 hypothetical protein CBW65_03575 [Tumebacillus avium]
MLDRYSQNMMLTSGKYAEEKKYWQDKLDGHEMCGFPADRLRQDSAAYRPALLTSSLHGETFQTWNRVSNGASLAWYMSLLLGVTYLLHRYTGKRDLTVGMPGFTQHAEGGRNRFYALRTDLLHGDTGRDLLLRIKETVTEARKYHHITYEMLRLQEMGVAGLAADSLLPQFQTLVLMSNLHDLRQVEELQADTVFAFELQADRVEIKLCYNELLYEAATMEGLLRHFQRVMTLVAGGLEEQLSLHDLLLADERERMLVRFNDTGALFPLDQTLHQLLAVQAAATPDQIAARTETGDLTYRELHEKSNQFAHWLTAQGVEPGERVAILAERSLLTLVQLFGILKAGATYVPLEPDAPRERMEQVLAGSGCQRVVSAASCDWDTVFGLSTEDLDLTVAPDALAYVIYTSGSTGVPKGVATTHRAALNTIFDINQKFTVGAADTVIGISSLCFDLSVYDIFGTVAAGATLVLVPDQRDLKGIVTLAAQHGVTVWNSVPAILDLAVPYLEEMGVGSQLRLFLLSGDWIPVGLFGKVKSILPAAQMISLGGATEGAIWSIYYPMVQAEPGTSVPYGSPLANQRIYVLSDDLQPCPYGVEGEICIGGAGVAVGYYNDPVRTAAAFVEHPEYGRLYKTGDYGVFTRHGYIKLHGRRDFQVKIHGFRVETQEIQAALTGLDGIVEAVITARGEREADKALCAYYVSTVPYGVEELRTGLQARLPAYMIPVYFVQMAMLPLSANGKIDLSALPHPDGSVRRGEAYEAPRNEVEERLAVVWQEVLQVERIGIHDNFFSLGGDSMKALRVIAKLNVDFSLEINDLFEKQTIANLAQSVFLQAGNLKRRIEQLKEFERMIGRPETVESQAYRLPEYQARNAAYAGIDSAARKTYRHIMLTGSTGYLGAHLLKQLLESTDSRVYTLVRGEDAQSRLEQKLAFYHGADWFATYQERVEIIPGDLSLDRFGLSEAEYAELAGRIDCILNPAANVKHYGRYEEFFGPNIHGVEELIEFAASGTHKDIHHICTVGIASGTVEGQPFAYYTEYDTDLGQTTDNFYHRTKMEAERLLLRAREERGLNVSIYRTGNLVFQSHSGKFQENIEDNAFYALIGATVKLQIVPEAATFLMDFTFVDEASRAILQLFDRADLQNEIWHVVNPNIVDIGHLANMLASEGVELNALPLDDFLDYLAERYGDHPDSRFVEHILRYIGIFSVPPRLTHFHVLADKTAGLLARTGFSWSGLEPGHVKKMLAYCRAVQFL